MAGRSTSESLVAPSTGNDGTRISFEKLYARLCNGGRREACELDVRLKPNVDNTGFNVRIAYPEAVRPPCDAVQSVAKLVYDKLPG